ncbi:TlpA family protein disulfide reductase [Flavobacterium muglaense]|nr:TlpA disulfide reductase family protein [Flavobacterium muglaense]
MYAESILNKKAPVLVVEKWISDIPDTKGKFVLIDFWATWCTTYNLVIPQLNQFKTEFENDLIIIGISDESKRKVDKLIEPKIEYYSAIDSRRKSNKLLKLKALPHCIIIDPYGIVRWEGDPLLKGFELTSDVIKDIIKKYKNPKN